MTNEDATAIVNVHCLQCHLNVFGGVQADAKFTQGSMLY